MSEHEERLERVLDEVSQQVAELVKAAGYRSINAYRAGDAAALAVKAVLRP